jgi:putative sigma-54 modulation protein
MIQNIDITGVKFSLDDTTKKYVTKKIGRLDRYLPKHARKSASVQVKLKEINREHGNKYEAEVILIVPDRRLTAHDSTMNMLAAIDIVEAKLVTQLKKYKEAHIPHVGSRGVLSRFKRSYAREL